MRREACDCPSSYLPANAVPGALLTAQWCLSLQCRLKEEKELIWKRNCFGDPKYSGRDNVEMTEFWESWHFWVGAVWKSRRVTFLKHQCVPHRDQSKTTQNPIKMFCLSLLSLYFYFQMPHLTQPATFSKEQTARGATRAVFVQSLCYYKQLKCFSE